MRAIPYPRRDGYGRRQLLELADWLRCWGVTRAGMEAASDYWKPVYFLVEREGLDLLLYKASRVKALPGRPKTHRRDSAWLAQVPDADGGERDRRFPRKPAPGILRARQAQATGTGFRCRHGVIGRVPYRLVCHRSPLQMRSGGAKLRSAAPMHRIRGVSQ